MIVLINPNSTASMTEAMLATAKGTAPGTHFVGWTSDEGPPAIQGREDGEAAAGPLLKLVAKASAMNATAIIIGCFDDTALAEAQAAATCPVIGIGQAAYHMAAMVGRRFSVVTTLAVSTPILEENIEAYGLRHHLAKVRASDVPVLDLEHDPEAAVEKVVKEILAAEREDDVGTVVLGCGGMVGVATSAAERSKVRLIDGVRSAAHVASSL